jgi:type I restriction enzyme S subunit
VDPTPFTVTELCSVIVGGVWGRPPGEADVDVLALGPRVFSGPSFALTVHGSPGRSVTKAQLASRSIQPADIILERSGGGPGQPVGRVVYAGDGLPTCIPTDFMRLLRPDRRRADPRYLFWRLQGDYLLGKSIPYQRRTTGIRNLDVPRYLGRRVTVPAIVEQEAFAHLCDSIAEVGIGYSQRIASLRATRLAISNDLLFGTHGIPPEYDTLVGAA